VTLDLSPLRLKAEVMRIARGFVTRAEREAEMVSAFISHSHGDRDDAVYVEACLKKNGVSTYLDQRQLGPGDDLPVRLKDGIEECDVFLLLWSAQAASSKWVGKEWDLAWNLHKRIVPYVLDGTPLPSALSNFVHVDGRADRQTADAGLLGIFGVEPGGVFPGMWQIDIDAYGLAGGVYRVELHKNGQLSGTGKMKGGGVLGPGLAELGLQNLLNIEFRVEGSWSFEPGTRILTINLVVHGLGQVQRESVQIHAPGRARVLGGKDMEGRTYTLKRLE